MDQKKLDEMEARLEAEPDIIEGESAIEGEVIPPVDQGLAEVMTGLVGGVSVVVCRKANVTGLEEGEKRALGEAVARLVQVYDVGPKDPKGAAWMGFGLTVVGIVANRRPLALPEPANDAPAQG